MRISREGYHRVLWVLIPLIVGSVFRLWEPIPPSFHYFFHLAMTQRPWTTLAQIAFTWGRLLVLYTMVGMGARTLWIGFFAPKKPHERNLAARLAMGSLLVLVLSAPSIREGRKANGPTLAARPAVPSFVVIGLDSVPSSVFEKETHEWDRNWKRGAITFSNAYAVTNSTYTSWFSMLSGKYPYESGVETLFPENRNGKFPPDRLLPALLKSRGYRTAYITDCAATSFFSDDSGFDERIQPDRGVFNCYDSLESSLHPLARAMPSLFTRMSGDCSASPDRKDFWAQVKSTTERLSALGGPFFVAAHTCATSPESVTRQSTRDQRFPRHGLSRVKENKQYRASVRATDIKLSDLLKETVAARANAWTIVLSDHGVKMDAASDGQPRLTHATGEPLSRHQYHVPLAFLPPRDGGRWQPNIHAELVPLPSLYSTILGLAGVKVASSRVPNLEASLAGGKLPSDTSVVLSSSLPSLSVTEELGPMLNRATLDNRGAVHLAENDERELLKRSPVSILRLPYRALFRPGGSVALFNETTDPHNRAPLRNGEPTAEIISELKVELCAHYPRSPCTPAPTPERVARNLEDRSVN